MEVQTFIKIEQLHQKYRPGIFGKVAQKLLALCFKEVGYSHIVERSVEGVDIDVGDSVMQKMALEVKTCKGHEFQLSQSNIDALGARVKDGYVPCIAGLRIAILEQWVIARVPITILKPGQIRLENLRPFSETEIETQINDVFDCVVEKYYQGALDHGLSYLTGQLKQLGVDVRDE